MTSWTGDSELNFRTVSTAEVEPGSWRDNAAGVLHLYKPVILNPLLFREKSLVHELNQGLGRYFGVNVPAVYSPHHSHRVMYLTDPPCKVCKMDLMFEETRPAPKGDLYRGCMARVRSINSLTLGDLIDGALGSLHMHMGEKGTSSRYDKTISEEDFFLARQTNEAGKRHLYFILFPHGRDTGLPMSESTFRPILLTRDEYLYLRPKTHCSSGSRDQYRPQWRHGERTGVTGHDGYMS